MLYGVQNFHLHFRGDPFIEILTVFGLSNAVLAGEFATVPLFFQGFHGFLPQGPPLPLHFEGPDFWLEQADLLDPFLPAEALGKGSAVDELHQRVLSLLSRADEQVLLGQQGLRLKGFHCDVPDEVADPTPEFADVGKDGLVEVECIAVGGVIAAVVVEDPPEGNEVLHPVNHAKALIEVGRLGSCNFHGLP